MAPHKHPVRTSPEGPFTIEVGPDTPPHMVAALERNAVAARPSYTDPQRSTLRTHVWEPLKRLLFGDPPARPAPEDLREMELRVASMVNQGVSLEDARRVAASSRIVRINARGYLTAGFRGRR